MPDIISQRVLPRQDLFPLIVRDSVGLERPFSLVAFPDRKPEVVSFNRLNNAVNRAAWFLQEKLSDVKLFVWMGKNDVRYVVWMLAAATTGKIVALPSLQNTPDANLALMGKMNAEALIYDPDAKHMLLKHLTAYEGRVRILEGLTWDHAMDETGVNEYPFDGTYAELKDRPFMAIHTSGTSGNPKPLYITTAFFKISANFASHSSTNPGIFPSWYDNGTRVITLFTPFPLCHFGGVFWSFMAILTPLTMVMAHPDIALIPDNLAKILSPGYSATCLVPVILRSMLTHDGCVNELKRFTSILCAGAPADSELGDAIVALNPSFQTAYAASELGAPPVLLTDRSKRQWDTIMIMESGQQYDEISPGVFELVIPRTEQTMRHWACFEVFPDLTEYRTRDLFIPVPGTPNAWRYAGRRDEWLVLANGLKYDPVPMQHEISRHPDIRDALIVGMNRIAPCLILEMMPGKAPSTEKEQQRLIESLWLTIETANQHVAKFGRVPRELILIASSDRSFFRTGKMSIMRSKTIQSFNEEIEKLYAQNEDGLLTRDLPIIKNLDQKGMLPCLQQIYAEILGASSVDADATVFDMGLDSFGAGIAQSRIRAALRARGVPEQKLAAVNIGLIFSGTTISKLAQSLSLLLRDDISSDPNSSEAHEILDLLEEFGPQVTFPPQPLSTAVSLKPWTVVLTGSTGSVGTHLLSTLLSLPPTRLRHIYCLNRSPSASARQVSSFKSRGFSVSESTFSRVSFVPATFGAPNLGLDTSTWEKLVAESSLIIHNAWPVNFLMPIESFRSHLASLVDLLRLSYSAKSPSPLLFISSISTAVSDHWDDGHVRESFHNSPERLLSQGYVRSKYVGEKLISSFVQSCGIPAAVLRVGQVAGPVDGPGIWNKSEWFPSLVRSSKYLGAIPASLGNLGSVDWVPVDELAKMVAQIAESIANAEKDTNTGTNLVFNVVNPHRVDYETLLPSLKEKLAARVVPATEWIELLSRSVEKSGGIISDANPGAKLLDFYREQMITGHATELVIDVGNVKAASKTARQLPSVNRDWLDSWLQGWDI